MSKTCASILSEYREEINEVINIQREDKREAIFFMYEDGSTQGPYKGSHTSISLSKDEEKRLSRLGKIVGSVHTHPSGLDPSTIDIVTALSSGQSTMCVATPVEGDSFILTCMKFDGMGVTQRRRVLHSMMRSSMGITNVGRMLRREFNFKRFNLDQCRVKG